jgi:hypothetical protein
LFRDTDLTTSRYSMSSNLPRIAFGDRNIGDIPERVHVFCQRVLYSLITLHVAGICYHVFVARDRLLNRMLPVQAPPAQALARRATGSQTPGRDSAAQQLIPDTRS